MSWARNKVSFAGRPTNYLWALILATTVSGALYLAKLAITVCMNSRRHLVRRMSSLFVFLVKRDVTQGPGEAA